MKLPTLFSHKNPPQHQHSVSSSTRHSCREQPKTHSSFRATPSADLNSSSTLRNSSAEELENVIRGVKTSSDRLFFSPEKSNSILENNAKHSTQENAPTTITIKSRDPYKDFRTSMEEMVKAHDLRDWDLLEELLGCYLMVNEKRNHCYIIRAFVDLVVVYSHIVHLTTSSLGCSSVSDSFVVTSSSSPLHFTSSSTTAGTSSSSSFAPKKAAHDGGRADKFRNV
ncbi:hypothetical protein QQ045_022528 [Rhodiola kirilowii]